MDNDSTEGSAVTESAEEILDRLGFDAEENILTYRQAEVIALRNQGLSQAEIGKRLGTSRANVSSIESSARENINKAHETVAFAESLEAPVQVTIEAGADLYDVPERVYDACDEAGVKVTHPAPEFMKLVSNAAGGAVSGREITTDLFIGVTRDGNVRIRRA